MHENYSSGAHTVQQRAHAKAKAPPEQEGPHTRGLAPATEYLQTTGSRHFPEAAHISHTPSQRDCYGTHPIFQLVERITASQMDSTEPPTGTLCLPMKRE